VGYVLAGCFDSAFDGEPALTRCAGEPFVDSAARAHRVFRNPGTTPLRFVIAYALRKGESAVIDGAPSSHDEAQESHANDTSSLLQR
jgi:hypothetical protein